MQYLYNLFSKKDFSSQILFIFLPITLVSGPAIADICISLIGLIFIYKIISEKTYKYINNKIFLFFLLWCIYLILLSLTSSNPLLSLESSLFYLRFIFFILALWRLIDINKNILLLFFWSLTFTFIILLSDGYYQYFTGYNILGFEKVGTRISSFFGDELILGSFLSRFFPILLSLYIFCFSNKSSIRKF